MAVYLVRHAHAADRSTWEGDDGDRPLSPKGHRQAAALAEALRGEPIDQILSSPAVRCIETVQPLADRGALPVEAVAALGEGEPVGPARRLLDGLADAEAVVVGHGDLIPALIDVLATEAVELDGPRSCKKASTWVLEAERGRFARATYRPPPRV